LPRCRKNYCVKSLAGFLLTFPASCNSALDSIRASSVGITRHHATVSRSHFDVADHTRCIRLSHFSFVWSAWQITIATKVSTRRYFMRTRAIVQAFLNTVRSFGDFVWGQTLSRVFF
jgi:hypothetical protein